MLGNIGLRDFRYLNTYIIDMRVSTRVDKLTIIEVPGNKKILD